jgi:hypothetical protein
MQMPIRGGGGGKQMEHTECVGGRQKWTVHMECKGNLTVLRRILYLDLGKGNPK